MAILNKKDEAQTKRKIDLTGPDGNAFVLLGIANDLGKQLGLDPKERGAIHAEMISGDYENLIKVFDLNFGDYIDLLR
jgi:hypothetical protein